MKRVGPGTAQISLDDCTVLDKSKIRFLPRWGFGHVDEVSWKNYRRYYLTEVGIADTPVGGREAAQCLATSETKRGNRTDYRDQNGNIVNMGALFVGISGLLQNWALLETLL